MMRAAVAALFSSRVSIFRTNSKIKKRQNYFAMGLPSSQLRLRELKIGPTRALEA